MFREYSESRIRKEKLPGKSNSRREAATRSFHPNMGSGPETIRPGRVQLKPRPPD